MEYYEFIRFLLSNMQFLILCQIVLCTGSVQANYEFDHYIQPTIENENVDTRFVLFTNHGSEKVQLNENNLNLIDIKINVKIIVHGWLNRLKGDWIDTITNEYLDKSNYNVIQVNWDGAEYQSYFKAAASAPIVGKRIGMLIVYLHKHHEIPLENFHLIGHSLGAHVCGYAGKEVINLTGLKISRISALDAASPLFEKQYFLTHQGLKKLVSSTALKNEPLLTDEFLQRTIASPEFKSLQSLILRGLNKTDADIVDAIHSDSCEFGYKNNLGTVDFYPNGGTPVQPGCPHCPSGVSFFDLFDGSNILDCLTCSHFRSCGYFIDSINNGTFVGTKCGSWNEFKNGECENNTKVIMGDGYVYSSEAIGRVFLRTNSESRFGLDV